MSSVIEFLDRMGRDANLRHAERHTVARALTQAGVDPDLQVAILAKDHSQLQELMGRGPLYCMQVPCDGESVDGDARLALEEVA